MCWDVASLAFLNSLFICTSVIPSEENARLFSLRCPSSRLRSKHRWARKHPDASKAWRVCFKVKCSGSVWCSWTQLDVSPCRLCSVLSAVRCHMEWLFGCFYCRYRNQSWWKLKCRALCGIIFAPWISWSTQWSELFKSGCFVSCVTVGGEWVFATACTSKSF